MQLLLTQVGLCDGTWKREDSTTEPLLCDNIPLSVRTWLDLRERKTTESFAVAVVGALNKPQTKRITVSFAEK